MFAYYKTWGGYYAVSRLRVSEVGTGMCGSNLKHVFVGRQPNQRPWPSHKATHVNTPQSVELPF